MLIYPMREDLGRTSPQEPAARWVLKLTLAEPFLARGESDAVTVWCQIWEQTESPKTSTHKKLVTL